MVQAFLSTLRSPQLVFLVFCVFLALSWHFSIAFLSPFSWLDQRLHVERLFFYYLVIHGLLLYIVSVWLNARGAASRWFIFAIVLTYGIYLLLRALDWGVLYYYGDHIDPLFWDNAFYTAGAGMAFTSVGLVAAISVLGSLLIFWLLLMRVIRHQLAAIDSGMPLRVYLDTYYALPIVAVFFLGGAGIHLSFSPEGQSSAYTEFPPEYYFARSIVSYLGQGDVEPVELKHEQKEKLASMGLPLEGYSSDYPLMKASVYLDGARPRQVHGELPNVVVIMAESFSSYFMDDADIQKLGVTPNLDAFRSASYSFSNIVNANTPTLQGQIATLASSLHVFRTTMKTSRWGEHSDFDRQSATQDASLLTRYPFISILLKKYGYESVHIQGGDAQFADSAHYFRVSAQYDDFISGVSRPYRDSLQYEPGIWGAVDIDTFNIASRWMEARQGGPFLLTISTMDVHHPYIPVVEKPGVNDSLLNTVYSTDAGFGEFWNYFINSRFSENTILIFTADHSLFPTSEYQNLRVKDVGFYDKIPLMVYSPFHPSLMGEADSVLGSQLDIAPTIFELLGLDSVNAFMGLSLLSDRKDYPYLFGKINLQSRFSGAAEEDWSDEQQEELINWIRYLASSNRLFLDAN